MSEFQSLLRPRVLLFAFIFCTAQLLQELIAEALFTQYEFSRPNHEVALVYCGFQYMGTILVAFISLSRDQQHSHHPVPTSPSSSLSQHKSHMLLWPAMFFLSLLIFASTALPNMAVEFVAYPAKVVAKSTKLAPTMVVSVLMGNSKRFTAIDYASAFLLCTGAAVFALSSSRQDEVSKEASTSVVGGVSLGLLLLGIASTADALVPNIQQFLMKTNLVSPSGLALRVNLIGTISILLFLTLSNGQALWMWMHIFFFQPMTLVLMCGGAGTLGVAVLAYTLLIQEAGSVVAVSIATARKVLTLTLSYLVFPGKHFGMAHLVSAGAVALGMALGPLYERYRGKTRKK